MGMFWGWPEGMVWGRVDWCPMELDMPGYGVCPSCWNGTYMPAEGGMVPRQPLGGRVPVPPLGGRVPRLPLGCKVPRPPLGGRVPRPGADGGNNPICKALKLATEGGKPRPILEVEDSRVSRPALVGGKLALETGRVPRPTLEGS